VIRQIALVLVLLALPSIALAQVSEQDRAAARELGREGIALYTAGDYNAALDRLSRAHDIVGLTTTGLWRARCLVALGRIVEASEQYLDVTRMKVADDARDIHVKAITEARKERDALVPLIPHVTLMAQGELSDDVVVTIDDQPVPAVLIGARRPIDPGRHEWRVARGDWSKSDTFTIAEGATLELTLPMPGPLPAALPDTGENGGDPDGHSADEEISGLAIAGWVTLGVGAAGVVLGVVSGFLALDRQGTLDSNCRNGQCPTAFHDDVDAFETLRTLSVIGIAAGGALTIAGVSMLAVGASGAPAEGAWLTISPGGAALHVRF
jgi:hypothetical protein